MTTLSKPIQQLVKEIGESVAKRESDLEAERQQWEEKKAKEERDIAAEREKLRQDQEDFYNERAAERQQWEEKKTKEDDITAERRKLNQEREQFNDEKKAHQKQIRKEQALIKQAFKDSDLITLNISGTRTTCIRSTLTQFTPSLLASMFSGRWEKSLARDKDGDVFLDFDPDCFNIILNWLRSEKLELLTPYPKLMPDQEATFSTLVRYLQLHDVITPRRPLPFHFHLPEVSKRFGQISEDQLIVKDASTEEDKNGSFVTSTKEHFVRGKYEIFGMKRLTPTVVMIWSQLQ